MNPDISRLHPYPFERLGALKAAAPAPDPTLAHVSMSIGEPQHAPPAFLIEALIAAQPSGLGQYPLSRGLEALRKAAADWLARRFGLADGAVDPATQVLPVNGTREALFAFAQAVVERKPGALVAMPNPFYQIYEGAALLAGAQPLYLDCRADNAHLPDLAAVSADTWQRVQLLYLCSPGNPTGAVMDTDYLAHALALADEHDFVIAADECYAEIYLDEAAPPPGLLQVCAAQGRHDFRRVVVFHSLSKRSNVPGLRSGFVAGDAAILREFALYRTYHGCAVPNATQLASIAAWQDDDHVAANRALYRAKFDAVVPMLAPWLDVERPSAAFYLWPRVSGDDAAVAASLWSECHLTVLPGSFLARDTGNGNPGAGRLRLSLVAPLEDCVTAAERIADWCRRHAHRTAR
ncbi:MAG: succinyldiaminopimelate transaminase [Gammaproteobacteria bacterium]|nr:succinyldiaminopimelate transaminase [Gammaproteobacteria bacterium]